MSLEMYLTPAAIFEKDFTYQVNNVRHFILNEALQIQVSGCFGQLQICISL